MPRRGVRSRAPGAGLAAVSAVVFAAAACTGAPDRLPVAVACDLPVIMRPAVVASATNVLSEFVTATVAGADSVVLRFGVNASLDSATPAVAVTNDSMIVPMFGLLAATTYGAQLRAWNR